MHASHKIQSWEELVDVFHYMGPEWYFRGQRDAKWDLTTNIARALKGTAMYPYAAEEGMIRDFMQVAHNYLSAVEIPQTRLEWLALMQHHGAPTRLLDWTRSPFVATYFALEDATVEGECALWAIDQVWLRRVAETRVRGFGIPGFEAYQLEPDGWTDEALDALIIKRNAPVVVPAVPRRLSRRLVAQQAVFLVPGNFGKTIGENLGDGGDSTEHFVKLEMPSSMRAQGLSQLQQMNITRATLFPGLDGFGQSLRYSLQAYAGEVMGRTIRSRHAPFPFLQRRWNEIGSGGDDT